MTINEMKRYKQGLLGIAMVAVMLSLSGCFSLSNPFGKRQDSKKMEVVAFANTEAMQLSSDDIANMLLGVGFTPDQVMSIGQNIHQALMLQGMAWIKQNRVWFAQMRVASGQIQIYITQRGFFIYDVKTHRFTLAPQSSNRQRQAPNQPQQQPQMPTQQPQTRQPYPSYPNYPTQAPPSQYQGR